jgi:hypothetical protein
MRTSVALIESSDKFRAIATAIRKECLREHWRLANHNTCRAEKRYEFASPHRIPPSSVVHTIAR